MDYSNQNNEEDLMKKEVNWQQSIALSLNRAWQIRATDKHKFKDAISAVYHSLFPEFKEDLASKVGEDGEKTDYTHPDDLFKDVEQHDVHNKVKDVKNQKDKDLIVCDYVAKKIMEVLNGKNILHDSGPGSINAGMGGVE